MLNQNFCYLNVPGLRNSSPDHWQSLWEERFPDLFHRTVQLNWNQPDKDQWVNGLTEAVEALRPAKKPVILIGHSIGCANIVHWFKKYQIAVHAALLVAPSDPEAPGYPEYITGFSPVPLIRLPFQSIVIASSNDHVVSPERARYFARSWGSRYFEIRNAGHFEPSSGIKEFKTGLSLLGSF